MNPREVPMSVSDAVSRVMKTLGFDKYFDIHSNLDEAVKAF